MPGSAAIDFDWGQVEWRFASEANRLAFQNDPQRYAPQYGGFCATAVSNGFTADGLPLGMQIAGRPFDEATVLRAAHAYEGATPWRNRRPKLDG